MSRSVVLESLRMIFAGIGAAAIIGALLFVTILIGILVNVMILLISGPLVDRILKEEPDPAA